MRSPVRGFFKIQKIQLSTGGRKKKYKKEKNAQRGSEKKGKMPGRVRGVRFWARIGPFRHKKSVFFFDPLILANFRAVSGRQIKEEKHRKIKKTFFKNDIFLIKQNMKRENEENNKRKKERAQIGTSRDAISRLFLDFSWLSFQGFSGAFRGFAPPRQGRANSHTKKTRPIPTEEGQLRPRGGMANSTARKANPNHDKHRPTTTSRKPTATPRENKANPNPQEGKANPQTKKIGPIPARGKTGQPPTTRRKKPNPNRAEKEESNSHKGLPTFHPRSHCLCHFLCDTRSEN